MARSGRVRPITHFHGAKAPLKNVRVLLRLPPLLVLESLPHRLELLSGRGGAGELVLLNIPAVPAGGKLACPITVRSVAAGKVYMQPVLAFLGGADTNRAVSPHGIVEVR